MEQITTRIIHLQRTSETDQVPAAWAVAEIQAKLAVLPADEREEAVLCGWRDIRIEHPHRLTDLEYVQAQRAELANGLRNAPPAVADWANELLRRAGL